MTIDIRDDLSDADSDDRVSDWVSDSDSLLIKCLFCESDFFLLRLALNHIETEHDLDLIEARKTYGMHVLVNKRLSA